MSQLLFHCKIPGRVGIKKNSKRIVKSWKSKKPTIISSEKYLQWAEIAKILVNQSRAKYGLITPISHYVSAIFIFKFKNKKWEIDTSNGVEGIADVLETCGIVVNDKLIKNPYCDKEFNCDEESTEVYIFEYKDLFNLIKENLTC